MARGVTAVKPVEPVDKSEPITTDDGYVLETRKITIGGRSWVFRELTVEETDQCRELATDKDSGYDPRKMLRSMIAISSVDPTLTLDQVMRAPQRLFGLWVDVINELADPDTLLPKDDSGNA